MPDVFALEREGKMLGAIAGDVIGSVYEMGSLKTLQFPLFVPESRFTDDTVCTVALADSLLTGDDYARLLKQYVRRYPNAGYGGTFFYWGHSDNFQPYQSWGNGSAMRVSPVAWAYDTMDAVLEAAEQSAAITHDHPEGIRGAQAIAASVFLARQGADKEEIRDYVESTFFYDLNESLDSIRTWYRFDVSCQGSVPQAITAFLESHDFEDAVRKAISLGGDSDTIACMAGAIAEAHYGGVPEPIAAEVAVRLDPPLLQVVELFRARYRLGSA